MDPQQTDRLIAALERARPKAAPVIVTGQNPAKVTGRLNTRVEVADQTAVYVEVYLNGVSSVTIVVEGAATQGGPTLTLPDSSAIQALTTSGAFVVPAGSQWVAFNITAISGVTGQGVTIVATAFSPSSSADVTASISGAVTVTGAVDQGTAAAASGAWPVLVEPTSGNWTDRSGTIAAGGTAQNAAAANAARTYLQVHNPSTTDDLYFNVNATAVVDQPSIRLSPGTMWENPPHRCPTGAVSVIGATTGQPFTVKEA